MDCGLLVQPTKSTHTVLHLSPHIDLFLLVESAQTHRRKGNVLLYLIQHFATSYDVPQTIAHPPLKHSQYRTSWAS